MFYVYFPFHLLNAQESEKDAVKKVVEGFFEAFHNQDSVAMKKYM